MGKKNIWAPVIGSLLDASYSDLDRALGKERAVRTLHSIPPPTPNLRLEYFVMGFRCALDHMAGMMNEEELSDKVLGFQGVLHLWDELEQMGFSLDHKEFSSWVHVNYIEGRHVDPEEPNIEPVYTVEGTHYGEGDQ